MPAQEDSAAALQSPSGALQSDSAGAFCTVYANQGLLGQKILRLE
jgi:hypothetical protein